VHDNDHVGGRQRWLVIEVAAIHTQEGDIGPELRTVPGHRPARDLAWSLAIATTTMLLWYPP
jgi:hypothetical protein